MALKVHYKTFKSLIKPYLEVKKHHFWKLWNTRRQYIDFRFSLEICTILPNDVIWHHSHSENLAHDRPVVATNFWYADIIHSILFRLHGLKRYYKTLKSLIIPFLKVMKHQKTVHWLQIFHGNMLNFTQWCHMASFTFR